MIISFPLNELVIHATTQLYTVIEVEARAIRELSDMPLSWFDDNITQREMTAHWLAVEHHGQPFATDQVIESDDEGTATKQRIRRQEETIPVGQGLIWLP
jgi:hypothetical protein